jgi:thiamine transport system permease protein
MPWRRVTIQATVMALPVLFLAAFWAYPLALIIQKIPLSGGVSQFGFFGTLQKVIRFTAWQAALSTAAAVALGLPMAYLWAHFDFRGKRWLQSLSLLPFILPPVVVASSLQALWGERGWLGWALQSFGLVPWRLQGLAAIILAHVFYNVVIISQLVSEFWQRLPPQLQKSSATLGANRWQTLQRVTIPFLLPALLNAGLLVFIFCWNAFGTVLLLGGVQYRTLEVEIYHQLLGFGNLPAASSLALVQLLSSGLLLSLAAYSSHRLSNIWSLPATLPKPHLRRLGQRVAALVLVVIWCALLFAPLLALVGRSFSELERGQWQGWTLRHYTSLWQNERQSAFFTSPLFSTWYSLQTAAATTVLALGLGIPTAAWLANRAKRWHWLESVLLLPLSTSAVTVGLGILLAYPSLRVSPWLLPLAHTLVAYPFVVRTLLPAWRSLRPQWQQAAATLGASPFQIVRTITLPLLRVAIINAARFAFCISLGEFGATLLLSRPEYATLPTAIYQALSLPGGQHYGQALALSTLLMLACAIGTWGWQNLDPDD